ncbi:hypothetical protein CARUB_v10022018mg [Capsella rubella]|uniref:NADP-dependent oxidoreductase domain-containing protein n=2 Tax=Capsella rubella TaxID=81985 RepID=R0ICU9_9BRAS|nr:hypothetical protein CARUB_v10022018mg [Capsella rubella]
MRKRICRHKSEDDDDDMFPDLDNNAQVVDENIRNCLRPESDFWFENLMDNSYDPLDEVSFVDDCCGGSDTDLSESSEFDVISEHVLDENDLLNGWKFLSVWANEDEGTLVSRWSSETLNSILLLSPDESSARSKEDDVLSSVSPWFYSNHSNDISLFHSERKEDQMFCSPGNSEDILRCSVSKEDPEIPCNSGILENDVDNSYANDFSCGDVINKQGSMEIMCIDDEHRLWNKDDEPVPICIVPPDGWESMSPKMCLLHQTDRCINEYNVHDGNIGEISPIPLTKTLERPSRPWSVCGSVAAVRNSPLMEDSSGACSSLDEKLYENVNSSEDRDEDLAQTTPSTLYQDEVNSGDEIDIDAMQSMAACKVKRIKLGSQGFEVSVQGLGCVGLNGHYGASKPETDAIALLHHAVNSGVTFFDTSDIYGPETNEVLLGKALKDGVREKMELATKFGISYGERKREIKGDPAYVRAACEASLKRLDVACIDLYYQHRIDTRVPIEITMGELKKLVEEGKIKYIGLSEASASTIRRAHAVHPITAVQLEWSLWTRDVEEEIVPTCRELGIGIVVYSPLGRGFFASGPKLVENLDNNDFRKALPRFQQENLDHNKILYEKVCAMSEKKGCTPAQLALAWVHHQGDDVCPIPGTTKIENLNQNIGALSVKLTPEEMSELETITQPESVKGERYMATMPTFKNSDTPPLSSWNAVQNCL